MKFKLYLKQAGEGCDYMIGCGSKMLDIVADTKEQAVIKAREEISERTHSECEIEEAFLIESFEDLSHVGQEIVGEKAEAKRKYVLEEKRKQLEKLKAELGEN